jgi:hypothetical protein
LDKGTKRQSKMKERCEAGRDTVAAGAKAKGQLSEARAKASQGLRRKQRQCLAKQHEKETAAGRGNLSGRLLA